MGALELERPPPGTLTPIGDSDPLRFYYKPFIGRIFLARINLGLSLLEGRFSRLLEVGYGSGLLFPTLARIADEVFGADLEPEPPGLRGTLQKMGVVPRDLVRADIQHLTYPDGHFDGVIAFSILEHLKRDELDLAMREVARVLQPGGRFLVGCPAVHKAMNAAFKAIGFSGIEHHHFNTINDVLEAAHPLFTVERRATLPRPFEWLFPVGWAPYTTVLLRKK